MGVMGTWCQLCSLPVQHDHYVPTAHPDRFNIYRHSPPRVCEPVVKFGPEHAWLLDAVGLPGPVFGLVEDGALGEEFVGHGNDDLAVVHRFCWEQAGQELPEDVLRAAAATHEWQLLDRYHLQLFDFESLLADGRASLLLPDADRVQRMLAEARRVAALPVLNTAELLRQGNCWDRVDLSDTSFWRFRADIPGELDSCDYDHFFTVTRPVGPELQMEEFETRLLAALQPHALMLAVQGRAAQWSWLCYTPAVAPCEAAVAALEPGLETFTEPDPQWGFYFTELHRHLAGRWEQAASEL